jgi:hypothetical protein
LRQTLNAIFSRVAVKPIFSVTTNSFEFIALMVARGQGIGCQIRVLTGPDPARPEVVYVPLQDPDIKPQVLACYVSASQPLNLAVTLCLKELQGALEDWRSGVDHGHPDEATRAQPSGASVDTRETDDANDDTQERSASRSNHFGDDADYPE